MRLYSTYNDEQLLQLLKEDNHAAFEAVYNRYWEVLYDWAYKRYNDEVATEDALQEVFIAIWQRRSELDVTNLEAYLKTAVKFKILDSLRKQTAQRAIYQPLEAIHQAAAAEERMLEKDLLQLLYAYADTLPAKRRQIFLLHCSKGLSTREIASRLAISQKTVQNQLNTAIQGLKPHITLLLIFFHSL